ncbi:unnamed protein product [Lampetra planeri]
MQLLLQLLLLQQQQQDRQVHYSRFREVEDERGGGGGDDQNEVGDRETRRRLQCSPHACASGLGGLGCGQGDPEKRPRLPYATPSSSSSSPSVFASPRGSLLVDRAPRVAGMEMRAETMNDCRQSGACWNEAAATREGGGVWKEEDAAVGMKRAAAGNAAGTQQARSSRLQLQMMSGM